MKVGVISRGSPDYLIDIVTDGLSRLLGRENISLDYNVRGGWGGQYGMLHQGFAGPEPFDIHDADALVGSVRSFDAIEAWMKKTGKKKIAVIDGEDDPVIRTSWAARVTAYFKREYMKGTNYSHNVLPLPFAAIPETLPDVSEVSSPVFFHAHGSNHIRAEISEAIRSLGYHVPSERTEKPQYNKALASSLVGVSARGGGWDTYRYWEIPYFGTALLSQRLEIVIPFDFEEGAEAVFFSGIEDMRSKLLAMVARPEQTMRMGQAGRRKCLTHHLSVNRAKTVMESLS